MVAATSRSPVLPLPDSPAFLTLDAFSDESLPAIPAIDDRTSVVSHTTTWTGNLESSGSLHIHGRVEGSLCAQDSIYVAEGAVVEAAVQASVVTIAGSVRGTIHCTTRFELLPLGRVAGDVHSPAVVIHEGAAISGEVVMIGDRQSQQAPRPVLRTARGG